MSAPTHEEEVLLFVIPLDTFIAAVSKYCTDREVRDNSPGPLKYTDCVAMRDAAMSLPRATRQVLILGAFGKAYVKIIKGVTYIIFRGYPGNRSLLQWLAAGFDNLDAPKYGASNAKMGFLNIKELPELRADMAKEAVKSVKIAFVLLCVVDVLEEFLKDDWCLTRLGVHLAGDMLKTAIAAAIGVALGAIAVGVAFVLLGAATAVLGVVAVLAGIGFSILAGFGVEAADKYFQGTELLDKVMEKYYIMEAEAWGKLKGYVQAGQESAAKEQQEEFNRMMKDYAERERRLRATEKPLGEAPSITNIPEFGKYVYRLVFGPYAAGL